MFTWRLNIYAVTIIVILCTEIIESSKTFKESGGRRLRPVRKRKGRYSSSVNGKQNFDTINYDGSYLSLLSEPFDQECCCNPNCGFKMKNYAGFVKDPDQDTDQRKEPQVCSYFKLEDEEPSLSKYYKFTGGMKVSEDSHDMVRNNKASRMRKKPLRAKSTRGKWSNRIHSGKSNVAAIRSGFFEHSPMLGKDVTESSTVPFGVWDFNHLWEIFKSEKSKTKDSGGDPERLHHKTKKFHSEVNFKDALPVNDSEASYYTSLDYKKIPFVKSKTKFKPVDYRNETIPDVVEPLGKYPKVQHHTKFMKPDKLMVNRMPKSGKNAFQKQQKRKKPNAKTGKNVLSQGEKLKLETSEHQDKINTPSLESYANNSSSSSQSTNELSLTNSNHTAVSQKELIDPNVLNDSTKTFSARTDEGDLNLPSYNKIKEDNSIPSSPVQKDSQPLIQNPNLQDYSQIDNSVTSQYREFFTSYKFTESSDTSFLESDYDIITEIPLHDEIIPTLEYNKNVIVPLLKSTNEVNFQDIDDPVTVLSSQDSNNSWSQGFKDYTNESIRADSLLAGSKGDTLSEGKRNPLLLAQPVHHENEWKLFLKHRKDGTVRMMNPGHSSYYRPPINLPSIIDVKNYLAKTSHDSKTHAKWCHRQRNTEKIRLQPNQNLRSVFPARSCISLSENKTGRLENSTNAFYYLSMSTTIRNVEKDAFHREIENITIVMPNQTYGSENSTNQPAGNRTHHQNFSNEMKTLGNTLMDLSLKSMWNSSDFLVSKGELILDYPGRNNLNENLNKQILQTYSPYVSKQDKIPYTTTSRVTYNCSIEPKSYGKTTFAPLTTLFSDSFLRSDLPILSSTTVHYSDTKVNNTSSNYRTEETHGIFECSTPLKMKQLTLKSVATESIQNLNSGSTDYKANGIEQSTKGISTTVEYFTERTTVEDEVVRKLYPPFFKNGTLISNLNGLKNNNDKNLFKLFGKDALNLSAVNYAEVVKSLFNTLGSGGDNFESATASYNAIQSKPNKCPASLQTYKHGRNWLSSPNPSKGSVEKIKFPPSHQKAIDKISEELYKVLSQQAQVRSDDSLEDSDKSLDLLLLNNSNNLYEHLLKKNIIHDDGLYLPLVLKTRKKGRAKFPSHGSLIPSQFLGSHLDTTEDLVILNGDVGVGCQEESWSTGDDAPPSKKVRNSVFRLSHKSCPNVIKIQSSRTAHISNALPHIREFFSSENSKQKRSYEKQNT